MEVKHGLLPANYLFMTMKEILSEPVVFPEISQNARLMENELILAKEKAEEANKLKSAFLSQHVS